MVRIMLAALPSLMLTVAIPLTNRLEPHIAGLPFVLAWLIFWMLATPVCLAAANRFRKA